MITYKIVCDLTIQTEHWSGIKYLKDLKTLPSLDLF